MIDTKLYHCIGNSISYRASLLSELHVKLRECSESDSKLCTLLLKKAPPRLHLWLLEDGVLSALFLYGKCDTKINFNDENYGFKDLADVKSKMRALSKAWKDVVAIRLPDDHETHRIDVYLCAVM